MDIKEPTWDELRQFVRNNIGENQSILVEHLFSKEIFNIDDIVNLYEDFETWKDNQDNSYVDNSTMLNLKEMYEDSKEMQEIFEWWIVDEWMAEKLEEQGEPILKNDYGIWWGRTCTGQAILLDHVIKVILMKCNNMEY
jgi:hypothetical protein